MMAKSDFDLRFKKLKRQEGEEGGEGGVLPCLIRL